MQLRIADTLHGVNCSAEVLQISGIMDVQDFTEIVDFRPDAAFSWEILEFRIIKLIEGCSDVEEYPQHAQLPQHADCPGYSQLLRRRISAYSIQSGIVLKAGHTIECVRISAYRI